MRPEIEEYLNGELTGEALRQFETELKNDALLRKEVAKMRPLLRDLRRARIAKNVDLAHQNRLAKQKAKRVNILVCTGLLCIGGVTWWLSRSRDDQNLPQNQQWEMPKTDLKPMPPVLEEKPNPSQDAPNPIAKPNQPIAQNPKTQSTPKPNAVALADKRLMACAKAYYQIPSDYEGVRGGSNDDILLKEAKIAFLEGRYQDALNKLDQQDHAIVAESRFLKGHILYAMSDYYNAYEAFSTLALDPQYPDWRDSAEWYQVLSGMASGRVPRADWSALLDKIVNDGGHSYRLNALKLKGIL